MPGHRYGYLMTELKKRSGTEEPGSEEGSNKWERFGMFPHLNNIKVKDLENYLLYT